MVYTFKISVAKSTDKFLMIAKKIMVINKFILDIIIKFVRRVKQYIIT